VPSKVPQLFLLPVYRFQYVYRGKLLQYKPTWLVQKLQKIGTVCKKSTLNTQGAFFAQKAFKWCICLHRPKPIYHELRLTACADFFLSASLQCWTSPQKNRIDDTQTYIVPARKHNASLGNLDCRLQTHKYSIALSLNTKQGININIIIYQTSNIKLYFQFRWPGNYAQQYVSPWRWRSHVAFSFCWHYVTYLLIA